MKLDKETIIAYHYEVDLKKSISTTTVSSMSLLGKNMPSPYVPNLFQPELWLLLITRAEASTLKTDLAKLATEVPLVAWRQKHRRIVTVTTLTLATELQRSLDERCPAVAVYTSRTGHKLDTAIYAVDLPRDSERYLNLYGWGQPLATWWPKLVTDLSSPDALAQIGWDLGNGENIPPITMPNDPTSASEYQMAFRAWVTASGTKPRGMNIE